MNTDFENTIEKTFKENRNKEFKWPCLIIATQGDVSPGILEMMKGELIEVGEKKEE